MSSCRICVTVFLVRLLSWWGAAGVSTADTRHPVPREHPRLLGSRERLVDLSHRRPEAYSRVVRVAREQDADPHAKTIHYLMVTMNKYRTDHGKEPFDSRWKVPAIDPKLHHHSPSQRYLELMGADLGAVPYEETT